MMTPKKLKFAQRYLIHGNGTEAAKEAKYSPRSAHAQACRLLKDADVKAYIAEKRAAIAKKADVTVERIVEELAKIGFSNLADYVYIDESGNPFLDFKDMPEGAMRAVQEITTEVYVEGHGKEAETVKKTKFKLHPKIHALELLGKKLGMFVDKHQHDVTVHHVIDLGFNERPPKDVTPPSPLVDEGKPA